MGKLAAAFAALRYGASLTEPGIWKKRQNLMNALIGLLGAAVLFLPKEVSGEDIAAIAGGIAAIAGVLNTYLTTATTDKVGVGAPVRSEDRGS